MKRLLAAALTGMLAMASPAAAKIHAVVVGINAYAHVPALKGAVNDAADLARVLLDQGAEVALLVDEAATRAAVAGAFQAAADRAVAGDMIVFSFAGHGFQLPESLAGDETDGKDEVFALQGFDFRGAAAGERLRDNDIAVLLAGVPPGVGVLFIADSCHSGTMTRGAFGPGTLPRQTRTLKLVIPLTDDPLPPPPRSSFRQQPGDFTGVIYASAAVDGQETPEVVIDGQLRGALSYAMARALEGAADAGDGETSLEDLRAYVRAEVRARTEAQQTPDVALPDARNSGLVARTLKLLFGGENPATPQGADVQREERPAVDGNGIEDPDGPLLALAPEPEVFRLDPKASPEAAGAAELLWDPASGFLTDRVSGDLLARAGDETALAAAVLKWRAARGLARWVPTRPADVMLVEGDGRHRVGETVSISVAAPLSAPALRWVILVNLASNGTVQLVWPPAGTPVGGNSIEPPGTPLHLGPIPVQEPVGADSLLAILTAEDETGLLREIEALDGTADPEGLLALLAQVADDPTRVRVGLLPIFTAPGE